MKRLDPALLHAPAILCCLALAGCFHHSDDDDDEFTVVANTAEIEPNDESASPNFLGVLRQGEEIRVSGVVDANTDEFDGFAIALTEESEIEFELTFTDVNGELDVWIYDPAIDDIALFFESDFSPERGVFDVFEPVLDFQIVVRAFSGVASYDLKIRARSVYFGATAAEGEPERGGMNVPPGFERNERALDPAVRSNASARYLGRETIADSLGEFPEVGGVILALDENGDVIDSAPVLRAPDGTAIVR